MMNLIKIIRATEWWEYKFPPILVIPYFIILSTTNLKLSTAIYSILFIISALVVGAIYVSILNDITDIEEDNTAGKKNNMARHSRVKQFFFLSIPICLALFFCWFLQKNSFALTFYLLSYVSFTLYSAPPFRLKKRGILGLFADASGSQMLPTLFAVSFISYHSHHLLSTIEILAIATWSLFFGLRGILWHQFHDLENDVRSGLFTIVQQMGRRLTIATGLTILTIELAAFLWLMYTIGNHYLYIALLLYIIYMIYRIKKNNLQVIIIKYTRANFDIVMNVFYQVFLPISILILISIERPEFLVLTAIHLLLFPSGLYRVIKNIFF
jgi:4-hydroxybenzoate polyprenyltransferase